MNRTTSIFNKLVGTEKILSLFLRLSGVAAKFLLVVLIVKHESLEFQGTFTLINQSIGLMIYFVGLDFYIFYSKKMVTNVDKIGEYFKNALLLYFASGLLVALVFITMSVLFLNLSPKLVGLMLLLFVMEHIGQELMRVYIVIGKVSFANLIVFCRTGLWSIAAVVVLLVENTLSLVQLLAMWIISSAISVIVGFYKFPNVKLLLSAKFDKTFIKEGISFSLLVFLSTICTRLIEYSDKYILALISTKKMVGIYSVYFQISNISTIVISTVLISFLYPKILKYSQQFSKEKLQEIRKEFFMGSFLISIFVMIGYALFGNTLFSLMGKQELIEFKWTVLLLLTGGFFLNISNYYNIVLIGFGTNKKIFAIAFWALLINVILNATLIPLIELYGAAIAQLCSGLVFYFYRKREVYVKMDKLKVAQ